MSEVPFHLRNQGIRVLEALGAFAYLTADQMMDIGISKSRNVLNRNTLTPMCSMRGPLIERRMYGTVPKKGKLPYLYKLTPKGAELLADVLEIDIEEIKYHKEKVQVVSGYYHRVAQSDFNIGYSRWAEVEGKEIDFFTYDYEMTGNPREGKAISRTQARLGRATKKPDMITRYQDGEKRRLLAVEIHNGKDSKRIYKQLLEYLAFIDHDVFEEKYQHPTALFVLSVHEEQNTLNSVKARLLEHQEFSDYMPLFLFNSQEQVKADFSKGWTLADGSATALF